MELSRLKSNYPAIVFVLWIVVVLSGCPSVKLISDYDETTDKSLTSIQQKTEDFIENLKKKYNTEAASYNTSKGFYDEMDRELKRVEFRVASIPDNDQTIKLVKNIRLVILGGGEDKSSLRDLHQAGNNRQKGIPPASLEIAQRSINQTISAALRLEIAKKRGTDK